jgi:hypothetical protein
VKSRGSIFVTGRAWLAGAVAGNMVDAKIHDKRINLQVESKKIAVSRLF